MNALRWVLQIWTSLDNQELVGSCYLLLLWVLSLHFLWTECMIPRNHCVNYTHSGYFAASLWCRLLCSNPTKLATLAHNLSPCFTSGNGIMHKWWLVTVSCTLYKKIILPIRVGLKAVLKYNIDLVDVACMVRESIDVIIKHKL